MQALLELADPQLQLSCGLLGLLLPQAPDGGGVLFAAAQRFEDLFDLAGIRGGQHFKAGDRLAGADAGALTLAVAAFDEGLHIAIGEVGLQIGVGIEIAVARQHLALEPVAAIHAQTRQGIAALLFGPGLEGRIAAALKADRRFIGLAEQQMQAGHLGINAHIAHRLQPLEG